MTETTPFMADTRPRGRRVNRGSGGIKFRKAWKFKGRTAEFLREILNDAPRPIVHVCCGNSTIGDILVDIEHANADVKADARSLPFRDVGTVLIDPPYQMPLHERAKYVAGCLAALRPGGLLILHAPWMPREKRGLTLVDAEIRKPGGGPWVPAGPGHRLVLPRRQAAPLEDDTMAPRARRASRPPPGSAPRGAYGGRGIPADTRPIESVGGTLARRARGRPPPCSKTDTAQPAARTAHDSRPSTALARGAPVPFRSPREMIP